VPTDKVIIEDQSTNLPENIRFALKSLQEAGKSSENLILVALPFSERRILAQCIKQFTETNFQITSSHTTFEDFPNEFIDKDETINLIVGELDRLIKFPAEGFSIEQDVPLEVAEAIQSLADQGYGKYIYQ
jgi:hypothetical protein